MSNSFALQLTVLSEMHQQLAYLKAAKQQHTMLELHGGKLAQLLFCQSAAIACTSAAAFSVQPPYVCSFQFLHDIMHNSHASGTDACFFTDAGITRAESTSTSTRHSGSQRHRRNQRVISHSDSQFESTSPRHSGSQHYRRNQWVISHSDN